MARTLTEIYNSAKEYRNKYLELSEFQNGSKMSIIDAFTWVVAACIFTFENTLDVFQVDIATDLRNKVNGTPAYYANALLKYQSGDSLIMNEEGTAFSYPTVDESKRIISKVSYSELERPNYNDKMLILKVAAGNPGKYERISSDELIKVQAYAQQISFAGTSLKVLSRKGDILVPRLTVYHDGAVSESEVYSNIEVSLNDFIANLDFDGVVYAQKIIDAIQKADHVVDVHIDDSLSDKQGIFVAQYDDDDNLIPIDVAESGDVISYETKIDRFFVPNSGFIKQSTGKDKEEGIQTWKESITLVLEK